MAWFWRQKQNLYLYNISRFTIGWNTSSYLGQFDSQNDYIFHRDLGWKQAASLDSFYNFEFSFNILIIDQIDNTDISPENFAIDFFYDYPFNIENFHHGYFEPS